MEYPIHIHNVFNEIFASFLPVFEMSIIKYFQLEKIDNEKSSWCACGHTKDNTLTVSCLPGLQYRFRVSAVNRIGDSEPLVSDVIMLEDGAMDGLVR